MLQRTGNERANEVYEKEVRNGPTMSLKPSPKDSRAVKATWVRAKYGQLLDHRRSRDSLVVPPLAIGTEALPTPQGTEKGKEKKNSSNNDNSNNNNAEKQKDEKDKKSSSNSNSSNSNNQEKEERDRERRRERMQRQPRSGI